MLEKKGLSLNEINSLIKRAERYLLSAEILITEGDYESSVSRTYYAMFYLAQAALLSKGLTYSSHKMIISAFGENFIKSNILPKELGRSLNRAFDKRQIGDYNYDFIIDKSDAINLQIEGEQFLSIIKNFLKIP